MPTEHVKFFLPDYAKGVLDESLRQGVEIHVSNCAECRAELETLRETLTKIAGRMPDAPPASYFSTLVPKVRGRLERQAPERWFTSPVITKLAVPFVVAVVVTVLLAHIPFMEGESSVSRNPLLPVVEGQSPEEALEAVLEASPPLWTSKQTQEVEETVVAEHLYQGHFLQEALASDRPGDAEDLMPATVQQLLRGYDDDEVNNLLQKLERKIL